MPYYSPLRYPGGKNRLSDYIAKICKINDISGCYIEPYAGGGAVALFLLIEGFVDEVIINDIDKSIFAFWHSIINRNDDFCALIKKTEVDVKNWKKQKEIQENKEKADLFELGFSTFFLNRTNRSGIISGGIIGGKDQESKYKIDCRFNKENLIKRIKKIGDYSDKINLFNKDAYKLIKDLQNGKISPKKSLFYLDPPYYKKGSSLYTNYYKHKDHKRIRDLMKSMEKYYWIISYDNRSEIRELYQDFKSLEYSLNHSAHSSKRGKEILFYNDILKIPEVKNVTDIKI